MKVKFLLLLTLFSFFNYQMQAQQKPRTIVTTDGEVDDMDSFIRLLLYANEMDIEGLVYSSSMWHYKGDGKGTTFTSEMDMTKRIYGERTELRWCGTDWMQEFIDKYAIVYPNLVLHDPAYPTPEYLKSIIRVGNIDFEGEMEKVTEGSDFIKNILLDNDDEPVFVQVWGGTNTLARALKSIEEEYKGQPGWENIYEMVSSKTFLYIILDQDATYRNYIEPNWPNIRTIYNASQFWCFAYSWHRDVPESQRHYLEGQWFSENIRFGHGPLLEQYYLWGDGRKIAGDPEHTHGSLEEAQKNGREQYDFISEGDSPSFLYLLDFGLGETEEPGYGGTGGRFEPSAENQQKWIDGPEITDFNPESGKPDRAYPQARWVELLQKDFAARADWCAKEYEEANHAPEVTINRDFYEASPGETLLLEAEVSDPDGDQLKYKWWNYKEAGSYPVQLQLKNAKGNKAEFTIPDDATPNQTLHVILEVSDDGIPSLTHFQRVVIKIK